MDRIKWEFTRIQYNYSVQGNKSLVGELHYFLEEGEKYVGCFSISYFVDE